MIRFFSIAIAAAIVTFMASPVVHQAAQIVA